MPIARFAAACALAAILASGPALAFDPDDFGRRYAEAWSSQEPSRVAAFFAESATLTINGGEPSIGRGGVAAAARSFMHDYPDMVVAMDRIEPVGDGYRFHWTFTGTHADLGCHVRISGYEEWTIGADGLVANSLGHYDAADWDRQIGEACIAADADLQSPPSDKP